jgi:hypothetical protein
MNNSTTLAISRLRKASLPREVIKQLYANYDSILDANTNDYYISDDHKKFCKTGNVSFLKEPIVSHITWTMVPFKSLYYNNVMSLDKSMIFTSQASVIDPIFQSFVEFNNYNGKFLVKQSVFNTVMYDEEWIRSQLEYIYSLPKHDLMTLKGYTYGGDVMANNYLRGTLNERKTSNFQVEFMNSIYMYFPLYFQLERYFTKHADKLQKLFEKKHLEQKVHRMTKVPDERGLLKSVATISEWLDIFKSHHHTMKHSLKYSLLIPLWGYITHDACIQVIKLFIEDLTRILDSAPMLSKPTILYRGVSSDYYLKGAVKGVYQNNGFVSSSLDIDIAKAFQKMNLEPDKPSNCCIQRILVLKKSPCLLMLPISSYPEEKEVLLQNESIYVIQSKKTMKTFYKHPHDAGLNLCFNDVYNVNVTDIVLSHI